MLIGFIVGFIVGIILSLLIIIQILLIRDRRTWNEAIDKVIKELEPTQHGDFIKLNQAEIIMRDAKEDISLGSILKDNE